MRDYQPCGLRRPRLTPHELESGTAEMDPATLYPRLTDATQAEEAKQLQALRLEPLASERVGKQGFHYEVVVDSSGPEFEE